MMKKILLILTLLFITGCNAEYTLIIEDNKFKDSLYLNNSKDKITNDIDNADTGMEFLIATIRNKKSHYTEEEIVESIDKIGYKYSYEGNLNELAEKTIIGLFYDKINVEEDGDTLTLSTSSTMNYENYAGNLENVTITIKTNRKLIETNADKKNNNSYTWVFESGDLVEDANHTIYLKLGKEKSLITYKTIVYSILILVVVIICAFIIKVRKANKFQ